MVKGIAVVFFLVQVLWGSAVFAHKITVFGYVDGGMVKTESTFSGGRAARHCQLSIQTGSGLIDIGETDEGGMLDFPVTMEDWGFDLVVVCGDGHRGTWRMDAQELQGVEDDGFVAAIIQDSSDSVGFGNNTELRLILRDELVRELGPIKRQLAELKKEKITLADIMGGLGYFLGLAGLASYMRFRKERR